MWRSLLLSLTRIRRHLSLTKESYNCPIFRTLRKWKNYARKVGKLSLFQRNGKRIALILLNKTCKQYFLVQIQTIKKPLCDNQYAPTLCAPEMINLQKLHPEVVKLGHKGLIT